jgi:hypothetical protein
VSSEKLGDALLHFRHSVTNDENEEERPLLYDSVIQSAEGGYRLDPTITIEREQGGGSA